MALVPWIRIGQPLEAVMDDYERIFDAWEAGGIRGLVFGRLLFADEQGGFTIPAVPYNPEPYRCRGLEPNAPSAKTDPAKEKLLHTMLEDAKRRGWTTLVFSPGAVCQPEIDPGFRVDVNGVRPALAAFRVHGGDLT